MTTQSSAAVPASGSKIVLGVDDAPENLFLLKAIVETGGYTFLGARSGAECIELACRIAPRTILLDIAMPGMNGFEICRRLRGIPELKPVPIAFVTSCKRPEDVKEGIAAGGNDFILKPVDRERLLDRLRHWTSRRV